MSPISFKSLFTGYDDQRSESAKIEPGLYDSLAALFPGERKRTEARVLKIAETEPRQIVTVLLRVGSQLDPSGSRKSRV